MDVNLIREKFQEEFEGSPVVFRSPGRINLIGEHTDYNDGFVMPASIDKQIFFAITKAEGSNVAVIRSLDYGSELVIDLQNNSLDKGERWEKYFRAAVLELEKKGKKVPSGFKLLFGGDIPIGAGLSSSAALCCGFLFALNEVFNLGLDRKEIALTAQATEHSIGLNCGIMDQYAVMFGQKDSFICLDCRSLEFETYSTDLGDYDMVLINSKLEHELTESAYNDRRKSCEDSVKIISGKYPEVRSLRDVTEEMLEEHRSNLSTEDFRRALYVIQENDRVQRAKEALQHNRLEELGQLLYLSHKGLSEDYEVSTKELDLLVELTKDEEDILGARMMGGGFGGCTINIIRKESSHALAKSIADTYYEKTGIKAEFYFANVSDGAQIV